MIFLLNWYFIKQDLKNGNIQAVLRIAEITEQDLSTKYSLHAANELGEADYRVMLFEGQIPFGEL